VISYLEGKLKNIYDERLMLFVGGVGYDILIPAYAMNEIKRTKKLDDDLVLYISFHQTERQPKPILVGLKTNSIKNFSNFLSLLKILVLWRLSRR